MNTAILYYSKHGTTAKVANLLADELLFEEVRMIDLNTQPMPQIKDYDCIIIGGSIYKGKIQKKITRFCKEKEEELLQKDLGLFICCLSKEKAREQFKNVYPPVLRAHSLANGCFGGEILLERMNFIERLMIKWFTGKNKSFSALNYVAIDQFLHKLKERRNLPDISHLLQNLSLGK